MIIDDLLEKFNLNWDDLDTPGHSGEKEYLLSMLKALEQKQVTIQTMKDFITSMKDTIEQQLIAEPEFNYILIFKVPNRKQIFLKARLQNCLLFEATLSAPERARKSIEAQLAGIARRGKNAL